MYIVFIRFFYLEVLLFYGGGCDGVGECSVKGALGVTRGGGREGQMEESVHRECNAKRGWVKMGRGVELHYNTF